MDPATLALAAAMLVAKKALESAGDHAGQAGWGVLSRVSNRLRSWFTAAGDTDALTALEVVEAAPDSRHAITRLADRIEQQARTDPDGTDELRALIEDLDADAGPPVVNFMNRVRDEASVGRIIQIQGGDYHEYR